MLINYSKLIGSSVIELKTQTVVGKAADFVIHKHDLNIAGLVLDRAIFSPVSAVSASDIVEMAGGMIIVQDSQSVAPIKEMVRINEAYREGFHGIYQKVVTKSRHTIGVVFDYLIDPSTLGITKFYVRSLLHEKIIASSSVVELKGKRLIIKDDFEKVKAKSPVVEPSIV